MNLLLAPAAAQDAGALVDLLNARPPAFWMRKVPRSDLLRFAHYAIRSPRCLVLVARTEPEGPAAGYIMAIVEARRFWLGLALRHPGLLQRAALHRFRRGVERGRQIELKARADESVRALPAFSWSRSGPDAARIIGLFVRPEHRRRGIATSLYFRLFEALKGRGIATIEEYMGPDYLEFAGSSTQACGWLVQRCRCEGYKLTKVL